MSSVAAGGEVKELELHPKSKSTVFKCDAEYIGPICVDDYLSEMYL